MHTHTTHHTCTHTDPHQLLTELVAIVVLKHLRRPIPQLLQHHRCRLQPTPNALHLLLLPLPLPLRRWLLLLLWRRS